MLRRRECAVPLVLAALALASLAVCPAPPAEANWLTRLSRGATEAGEAGSKAGKFGILSLDEAAAFVARLPAETRGVPLAAHVTQEGHWKFVNRTGEVYTAASPEELARVATALAPGVGPLDKLTLYLSEDTVFAGRASLKDLPASAELHVVADTASYRLVRTGSEEKLLASVRDNLSIELTDQGMFQEAVFQLARPLNKSNIRVLALEPGGPVRLDSVPRFDPATKAALVDGIDPSALAASLAKLKGQTVLVTGRVENGVLHFKPSSGAEQSIKLDDIRNAAGAGDVNLIILESASPRQPGGRNWLWQKIEVPGLDEALERATFADFLNVLGAEAGQLTVSAAQDGYGRTLLHALPSGGSSLPLPAAVNDWVGGVTGNLLGNVAVHGILAFVRNGERQRELDARFIPGIPSWIQITYAVQILMGLIGWEVSSRWYIRIWPPESRDEYSSRLGYGAARLVRRLAYLLLFLPVVGLFAFTWTLLLQLWHLLTSPVRFWRWLRGRPASTNTG